MSQADKHAQGGGIDDEKIEVLYLKRDSALAFIRDESYHKTPALGFAINYFFDQYRS